LAPGRRHHVGNRRRRACRRTRSRRLRRDAKAGDGWPLAPRARPSGAEAFALNGNSANLPSCQARARQADRRERVEVPLDGPNPRTSRAEPRPRGPPRRLRPSTGETLPSFKLFRRAASTFTPGARRFYDLLSNLSDQPQPMLRHRFWHSCGVCRRVVDDLDRSRPLAAIRAFQAADNVGQGHLPPVRRGEVTERQRSAGVALASDAEPQMRELGKTGRPGQLDRKRRLDRRQRRAISRSVAASARSRSESARARGGGSPGRSGILCFLVRRRRNLKCQDSRVDARAASGVPAGPGQTARAASQCFRRARPSHLRGGILR
jgi:hypothetical protein